MSRTTRPRRRALITRRRRPAAPGAAAVVALTVAVAVFTGCSSSGSSSTAATIPSNATATPGGATGAPASTGDPSASAPSTTAGSAATAGTLPPDTVIVSPGPSPFGNILVDSNGHTLYIYTGDTSSTATCVDACAKTWPAVVGNQIGLASSLAYQPGEFKAVSQPNGTKQLVVNGRPVYNYAGDKTAGQLAGQGVGGQWFVIGTDGKPITKKS